MGISNSKTCFDGDTRLEQVAQKALTEEFGATFERLEKIGSFYSNSAISDEGCRVFVGVGTALSEKPKPEPTENIEILFESVCAALDMAADGRLKTGPPPSPCCSLSRGCAPSGSSSAGL